MTQSSSLEVKQLRKVHNDVRTKFLGPKVFIKGYNGAEMVENILKKYGWIKVGDNYSDDFILAWTELSTQINYLSLKPTLQLVNHIPNNGILTNKLGLLQSLRDYDGYCKRVKIVNKFSIDDFTPKTYIIDDANERNEFTKTFKDGDIWICKPTGANQGKGISLIRNINKFKQDLTDVNMMHKNMWSFQPKIAQRYITNPLLIEGRKFDIRCYMLIASTIPYLVLFCPGYIRLSINKYSNDDDSLITHLTNQFVQKQSPKYNSVKNSTIWSIDQFNDYYNDTYCDLPNFQTDWVKNALTDRIKEILLHVFKSVEQKLAYSVGFFELFGLDFMVDENLKVWLIEANSNPSMSSSCSLLQQIIPPMIEEVLLIALECFEKNTKLFVPLLPLINIKQFHLIYTEATEDAFERKSNKILYKTFSPPKSRTKYEPIQEVKVSKYTGMPTVPLIIPHSMLTRITSNDIWFNRWKKKLESQGNQLDSLSISEPKITLSLLTKHPRSEPMMNETLSTSFKTLFGDAKSHSKSIGKDINLNIIKEPKESSRSSVSSSKSIGSKTISQSKLMEILKNANA